MLTQDLPINSAIHLPSHVVRCKVLSDRKDYVSCHVRVPDMEGRLPAIALDGKFYSFLKAFKEAGKALKVASRLGKREDEIAMTLSKRGYAVWVIEPQARFAPPAKKPQASLKPAFGPSPCLLIGDPQAYSRCSLQVADLEKTIPGLRFQNELYSIFRVEAEAKVSLQLVSKLANRGDATLLGLEAGRYVVAVQEPTAIAI